METRSIDDLKGNVKNPRKISKTDFENLKKSIDEFGDISGVIFNTRTQQLAGGHQRIEAFKRLDGAKHIEIAQRLDQPTKRGTVAIGFVNLDGERYSYREVDWPLDREIAANIAANRITGTWDLDLLAENDQWLLENNPDLLEYTGQSKSEISRLLGDDNDDEDDDENGDDTNTISIKLDAHQFQVVERAIAEMKARRSFADEANTDFDGNAIYFICDGWLRSIAHEPIVNQPETAVIE